MVKWEIGVNYPWKSCSIFFSFGFSIFVVLEHEKCHLNPPIWYTASLYNQTQSECRMPYYIITIIYVARTRANVQSLKCARANYKYTQRITVSLFSSRCSCSPSCMCHQRQQWTFVHHNALRCGAYIFSKFELNGVSWKTRTAACRLRQRESFLL